MEEKSIESLAEELGRAALKHGARIATAESCTAGHYIRSRFERLV